MNVRKGEIRRSIMRELNKRKIKFRVEMGRDIFYREKENSIAIVTNNYAVKDLEMFRYRINGEIFDFEFKPNEWKDIIFIEEVVNEVRSGVTTPKVKDLHVFQRSKKNWKIMSNKAFCENKAWEMIKKNVALVSTKECVENLKELLKIKKLQRKNHLIKKSEMDKINEERTLKLIHKAETFLNLKEEKSI